MKPSERIVKFIKKHHVLSLSVLSKDNQLWACNAFYVFDEDSICLYILSELKTEHAKAMLINPNVAGTINVTPKTVAKIQGVQYQAIATLLTEHQASQAYKRYYQAFPFARVIQAPIWSLQLQKIKMTDNLLGFAHKENWSKNE